MKQVALIVLSLTLVATAVERRELMTLVREKKFEQAFALVEKELNSLPETNAEARAQLFSYQGELFLQTQQIAKAVESFSQCLSIREKIPSTPSLLLETHLRLARAHFTAQQHSQSVASYEKAIAIANPLSDHDLLMGLKAEFAETLLKRGDVPAAWKWISGNPLGKLSDDVAIHWFSVRSKVSFASGSYAEAYHWQREASKRWEKIKDKDPQTGMVIEMESCALAQRLNRGDDARVHLQHAKNFAMQINEVNLAASTRWSLAVLNAELSDAAKKLVYEHMVAIFDQCKMDNEFVSKGSVISAQVKLASLALDAKDDAAALRWCDQLDDVLPDVDSFRSLLHRYRAAAFFHQQDFDRAQQEAIESAQAAQRWLRQNRIFGIAENMIGLENSVDLLSPLMNFTKMHDRASILDKFLLDNHDDGLSQWIQLRRTLHQGDQKDAMRKLFLSREVDRANQIANQFQEWSMQHRDLSAIRGSLPATGACVHYFIYRNEKDENHYAAIVRGSDQKLRCVELGKAEIIHGRIRALIKTSEMQATDLAYKGTSPLVLCESLYDLLWAPLGIADQEVIIRPSGLLQFVPWSILRLPSAAADAGYLCQLHRSLRVIATSHRESRPAATKRNVSLLGVAEFEDGSEHNDRFLLEGETFSNLPGVRREFAAIESTGMQAVYQNTQITDDVFREPLVLSSSILHISCHGFVQPSDDPLQDGAAVLRQSVLVLHDYGKRESGLLYVGEAAYLPLDDVHAVVLSLCRGGLSNHSGMENWSSLRRAFLAAGVSHAAAAQWEIVDNDMQFFMKHLYSEMQRGADLPAAMQKTQCDWVAGKIPHAAAFTPAMRIATAGAWVVESAGW